MTPRLLIVRDPTEIMQFVDCIRSEADSQRHALGFTPKKVYVEQILARRVILLVASDDGHQTYAGHLMFGGLFPRLRIYQIAVRNGLRCHGGGGQLIRALISQAEREGYLSISAYVAADLVGANRFYERNGFVALRRRPGGATRKRTLVVRVREVESRSLLTLMSVANKPIIQFGAQRATNALLYAIDLNVLLDLVRDRPRTRKADTLFNAALRHEIRLAVTAELPAELMRTSKARDGDPLLSFARNLPQLPKMAPDRLNSFSETIEEILFPNRDAGRPLSKQNSSDVAQLAHAAAAGAAGFITSDKRLLQSRDTLLSRLQLDVISLSECIESLRPFATPKTLSLAVEPGLQVDTSPNVGAVLHCLRIEGVDVERLAANASFQSGNIRCAIIRDQRNSIGASVVGAATPNSSTQLFVWVDQYHPLASTIADHLIGEACSLASRDRIVRIQMEDDPLQPITRRIAWAHGFTLGTPPRALEKIAVGRAVATEDWADLVGAMKTLAQIQLPAQVPDFRSKEGLVQIHGSEGNLIECRLMELETLLSPVVFALPGRNAVLVPIEKKYAADLIGTGNQLSFLSGPEAGFLRSRTYFNSPRAASVMTPDAALVFYESRRSGGAGAAVAIARIVDVTQVGKDCIPEDLRRGGVVRDATSLSASYQILATTFDNLIRFRYDVSLDQLRRAGCVGPANLRTATSLQNEQFAAIVAAGFGRG